MWINLRYCHLIAYKAPFLDKFLQDLSGGVKALIMMLKTAFPVNASKCGDNCAKWILKIAEIKDLEIDLEHIMIFDKDFDAVILNDGKEIHDRMSYITEAVNYL